MKLATSLPLSAFVLAVLAACYDPVHSDDVASLGDEAPGVPEGPLHRPGQNCLTCHGEDGPGSPEWSVAGTVYAVKGKPEPAVGATVTVTDHVGAQYVLTTNEAGNFYVERAAWDPVYPLSIVLQSQGTLTSMSTTIGRNGGCGTCHRGGGDNHFMPNVYVREK